MIRHIERDEIKVCVQIIRNSFKTQAQEFSITKENCPGNATFMKIEKLYKQYEEGRPMFAYIDNANIVGYFSLKYNDGGSFELNNLAILAEYRSKGYGKEMIVFAMNKAREMGANRINIGLIEESTILKNWYIGLGFIHTGSRKFKHLPFTVGFMKIEF